MIFFFFFFSQVKWFLIDKAVACNNILGAAFFPLFSQQRLCFLVFFPPSSSGSDLIKVRSEGGRLQAFHLAGRGICLFFSKGVIRAGGVHPLITHAGEECSLIIMFACRRAGGELLTHLGCCCEMSVCPGVRLSRAGWAPGGAGGDGMGLAPGWILPRGGDARFGRKGDAKGR